MGQDLLLSVLEMPGDEDPDWAAANACYEGLSEKRCCEIVNAAKQLGYDDPEAELDCEGCAREIKGALDAMMDGWAGDRRDMVRITTPSGDELLIAGGDSWGDSVEGCDLMALFYDSGMAEAAGFIIEKTELEQVISFLREELGACEEETEYFRKFKTLQEAWDNASLRNLHWLLNLAQSSDSVYWQRARLAAATSCLEDCGGFNQKKLDQYIKEANLIITGKKTNTTRLRKLKGELTQVSGKVDCTDPYCFECAHEAVRDWDNDKAADSIRAVIDCPTLEQLKLLLTKD
jgi:hypothetical protein